MPISQVQSLYVIKYLFNNIYIYNTIPSTNVNKTPSSNGEEPQEHRNRTPSYPLQPRQ